MLPRRLHAPSASPASGRIPRVTRLLALAHKMQGLIDAGTVRDYSELARIGGASTGRITQIMSLLLLAPKLQAAILDPPAFAAENHPLSEREILQVVGVADWNEQLRLFRVIAKHGSPVACSRPRGTPLPPPRRRVAPPPNRLLSASSWA